MTICNTNTLYYSLSIIGKIVVSKKKKNQIKIATERDIKESRVDSMIVADASWVSLFNCAERTYNAGDVGRVKKIIPALNAIPVTEKTFKRQKPMIGKINPFKTDDRKAFFI